MIQRTIEPSAVYKIFVSQPIERVEISRDHITLLRKQGPICVPSGAATITSRPNWLFLRKITLSTPQGSFDLAGISSHAVADIESAIRSAHQRQHVFESLLVQSDQVGAALVAWDALATRDAYLTRAQVSQWQRRWLGLTLPKQSDEDLITRLPADDQQRFMRIFPLLKNSKKAAAGRNALYVQKQLQAYQAFFDTVQSHPLTDQQRHAIVYDEDNALVIAGAGTGKTATVVGKVGYILKKGWATPDEILLLAFTAKAAEEMRTRIEKKLGIAVKVRTFHALGQEIIAQVQGKKPSLYPGAEDAQAKSQILQALITEMLTDDHFRQGLLAFQSTLRRAYKPAWEFETQADYTQYLLDVEPRALNGLRLKSYEECEIANWLVTHGIAFEYERRYEIDTATRDFRQYKPDFYLTDQRLYIEHFGIDRNNNTAPFVAREKYLESMQWKRQQHAQNGTRLVETYSWERQEGVLLTNLEAKLRTHGVEPHPLPMQDALELMNVQGQVTPYINLFSTFLSLFKSAGLAIDDLHLHAERGGEAARAHKFAALFAKVYASYEAFLTGRNEIDFDDMIALAHKHVAHDAYKSQFRYILVDEFQDISMGRAKLIQALKTQRKGAKLFCVGDDWQSIYRFTGSDIVLTTAFETHFGCMHKTVLNHTFRFHDKIADFSSRFVQRNPHQIRKQLSTAETSEHPGVVVYMKGDNDHKGDNDPLILILTDIDAHGKATVYLLARYSFHKPDTLPLLQLRFPTLKIRAMTAHGSKGLEADYVVITNLSSGKYGFPSEIADDPVLGMVLAESESFEHAEERRLFYVALTRARKRVYLVADSASPSVFVREVLADPRYEKAVVGGLSATSDDCPACERGTVKRREGEFGIFYSCSNYPVCTYKRALCSRCRRGGMRTENGTEAQCNSCGYKACVCPRCHVGVLMIRSNNKNQVRFWGCSNYGLSTEPCRYTKKMALR